jgi:hypothetical protein
MSSYTPTPLPAIHWVDSSATHSRIPRAREFGLKFNLPLETKTLLKAYSLSIYT